MLYHRRFTTLFERKFVKKVKKKKKKRKTFQKVHVIFVYTNDVVILGSKEEDIIKITEKLIKHVKIIELVINEEKRSMIERTASLTEKSDDQTFEKYLRTEQNTNNNYYKEIKRRITASNKCKSAL